MKFFVTLCTFLLLAPFIPLQAQIDTHPPVHEIEARRYQQLSKRADFVSAAAEQYDVHYYRLDVALPDDPFQRFGGNIVMRAKSLVDNLDVIEFNFGTTGRLDSVHVHGTRLDPTAISRSGDVVALTLPAPLSAQADFEVTTWYSFPYGGSAIDFKDVTNSDLGKPGLSIASQAEPYDARNWWPCKDDPADKADSVDIILTTAEYMFPVSNGTLISDVNNGDGTRTVTWHSRYPIVTYLVSVAAAEYNYRARVFSWDGIDMPVENWWYSLPSAIMENYEIDMMDGLQKLSELFGPYPFIEEKYGMAEYEWGGAMEHQTVSSMGFYNTDVVIHELAHQWFGDKVTCATFEHIWLNEGWATYSEALFHEARSGYPALKAHMARTMYFGPGTIFVPDPESNPGRIFNGNLSYNKASWVVHMLRGVMGDDAFFSAVRKYLGNDDPSNYRSVVTAEFQQYMEDEIGAELDWFFQQWIYGEYYPTYQVDWIADENAGTWEVTLNIEQILQDERQLFTMPVPVFIRFMGGSDTTITVWNDQAIQQYTFTLDVQPDIVLIDPDNWILKRVIEKVKNPTFDKGILIVNGVDWSVDVYRADLEAAMADSVFSGALPYTLWDIFPRTPGSYPAGVPDPIGSGVIPASVLGQYCTVVWLGNAYNGDEAVWNNTSMWQYLTAGGNILLITRMGATFIHENFRTFLGLTWAGSLFTARDCKAEYPSLLDMTLTGDQSLVNAFNISTDRPENDLLFSETQTFGSPRGLGVWGKPVLTEEGESGHMMFISLRPYRIDRGQLKDNLATLLQELPCTPVTDIDVLPGSGTLSIDAGYPNPLRAGDNGTLRFSIPAQGSSVTLRLYDMLGRVVREVPTGQYTQGTHSIRFASEGLPSGVYTLTLSDGARSTSRMMVIMD